MGKKGRPRCIRAVEGVPEVDYFKPRGIPLIELEASELKVEELEAIRLVDYEDLDQEEAAKKMMVSRRTLARELKSGRKKIADALLNGKAIKIRGGYFLARGEKLFQCTADGHEWKTEKESTKPRECPECGNNKVRLVKS